MNLVQQQLHRDGFVCIRDAFDPNSLAKAENLWQHCIDHPGPGAARLLDNEAIPVSSKDEARRLDATVDGFFYHDRGNTNAEEQIAEVIHGYAVSTVLKQLFAPLPNAEVGLEAWFLGEQIFFKEPASPRTGWHQDLSDAAELEGRDMLVLWMSFDAVAQQDGLEMVRGSHLGPVYDSIYGAFRSEPVPDIERHRDDFDIVSFATEPGDIVVFHFGVLHGGGATRRDSRRSLALRFTGPDCRLRQPGKASGEGPLFRPRRLTKVL